MGGILGPLEQAVAKTVTALGPKAPAVPTKAATSPSRPSGPKSTPKAQTGGRSPKQPSLLDHLSTVLGPAVQAVTPKPPVIQDTYNGPPKPRVAKPTIKDTYQPPTQAKTLAAAPPPPAPPQPSVPQDIMNAAMQYGVPPALAIATAMHESGLNPNNNAGDQGTSFGLFQLHQGGELPAGMSPQQADNPVTNSQIALSNFPGAKQSDPGAWAAASQRPGDPAGYAQAVDANIAKLGGINASPAQVTQALSGIDPQALQPADKAAAGTILAYNAGSTNGGKLIADATSQLGLPYQWGGESPGKNFDCSGLVQWSASQAGFQNVPRTSEQQYSWLKGQGQTFTNSSQAKPGDLVFMDDSGSGPGHVAIYMGNGMMVQAPHTGANVDIVPVPTGSVSAYGRLPGEQPGNAYSGGSVDNGSSSGSGSSSYSGGSSSGSSSGSIGPTFQTGTNDLLSALMGATQQPTLNQPNTDLATDKLVAQMLAGSNVPNQQFQDLVQS